MQSYIICSILFLFLLFYYFTLKNCGTFILKATALKINLIVFLVVFLSQPCHCINKSININRARDTEKTLS